MALYKKKPVIVEAVQLKWNTWNEICEFADVGSLSDGKPQGCYIDSEGNELPIGKTSETLGLKIPTLEGIMLARENDWIIKGVNNELYPCKPDIFEKTYERFE